jgi:cytochrome c553
MRYPVLVAVLFAFPAAHADEQVPQAAKEICAACHGPDGTSPNPQYPSIAAQHASYLAKQLREFRTDERKSPIMGPIAKALSDKEIAQLAAYYSRQKPAPRSARDANLVAKGEKLFRGGNSAEGVPACAGCHSPNGAGIPKAYPRLAGQHADYVIAQLRAFRSEERANDPSKAMRAIASRMTEDEMRAVAEYILGLR